MSDRLNIQFGWVIATVLFSLVWVVTWRTFSTMHFVNSDIQVVFPIVSALLVACAYSWARLPTSLLVLSTLLAPILYVECGNDIYVFAVSAVVVLAIGFCLGRFAEVAKKASRGVRAALFFFYMGTPLCVLVWVLSLQKYGMGWNVPLLLIGMGALWGACQYTVGTFEDRMRLAARIERFVT